jgi:hypothetical protein
VIDAKIIYSSDLSPASAGILLDLLFAPDNGGDIFLRNVGLYANYAASYFRTAHSSLEARNKRSVWLQAQRGLVYSEFSILVP